MSREGKDRCLLDTLLCHAYYIMAKNETYRYLTRERRKKHQHYNSSRLKDITHIKTDFKP